MEITQNLQWRYATKKFDPDKKLSSSDLEKIKQATMSVLPMLEINYAQAATVQEDDKNLVTEENTLLLSG